MKTEKTILKFPQALILLITVLGSFTAFAQTYNLSNNASKLTVYGTSSLHDWEIVAEKQSGAITIENAPETPTIKALTFEVVAESLKSGKSAMDKNTYKALNTSKYKTITYKLSNVKSISSKGSGKYSVSSVGELTISGVTNKVNLDFTLNLSGSEAKLTGEYAFKMSQFKIDPPTAMFGTITTGDELKVKFNTVLKQ